MRLGWSKSKYSISYYVQKGVYVNGKTKSLIVKRFGSEKYICETYGVTDAKAWAQEQVDKMNREEQEEKSALRLELYPSRPLKENEQFCFNGGYLFLQDIYYRLGLDRICLAIAKKHHFEYNLNAILSRLIYTRILFPSSKRSSVEDSHKFIEQPDFDLHQVYRALSVLNEESDYIQQRLFKNSCKLSRRKTGIIYYDCTNFYFEIEQADGIKQYGYSKEHRPNPIVGMGLFMDSDGFPLAFSLYPGNANEQTTLVPLEKKLIDQFDMSSFVVCTDSGLSSTAIRKFNDYDKEDGNRSFITVQSLKKMKSFLRDWCLDPAGWYLKGDSQTSYNLDNLDDEKDKDKIFYKSRWIKEDGLEQQLIVSYSIKYRDYLRGIRNGQIERAIKKVDAGKGAVDHKRETDPSRFIKVDHATKEGEIADKARVYIDEDKIREEEKYDGFYAVCTNLEDDAETVIRVNKRRWEIEECFRIMKTDFEARPVYLAREDRITAHFMTCFIALIVFRHLERMLGERYTCSQIIDVLSEMNFRKFEGIGYVPTYTRNELTNSLHEAFGFDTAREIIPTNKMRLICAGTKKGFSKNQKPTT